MSRSPDAYAGLAGCYVHTPFCSAICPYCDFAVVSGKDHLVDRYRDAVIAEVGRDDPWRPIEAAYFGGGTPSRVPVESLRAILAAVADAHGLARGAEVTVEANPEDWSPGKAAALRSAGFSRVSFGAQSFDPVVLAGLGRRHGPEEIDAAIAAARREGLDVSLDLIYGAPEETNESWVTTLERAVSAGPDHVSCYALTVEPGTELGRLVRDGAPAPDPDVQADRFESADRMLTEAGLRRYEVSNWAVPGKECAYNSLVWAQGEYVAYGNGAHRYRDGVRSRNIRHLETYVSRIEAGASPVAGEERVAGWDLELDRIFVGLRRVAGVATGPGVAALLDDPDGKRLLEAGVVEMSEGRLRVSDPMLTDAALRVVIGLQDGKSHSIGIP